MIHIFIENASGKKGCGANITQNEEYDKWRQDILENGFVNTYSYHPYYIIQYAVLGWHCFVAFATSGF
jgi:hypothetical protein